MSQSDFTFSNDIRAAIDLRTPRTSRTILFAAAGLMATFLIWANFAVLDEVKRGNGKVVPSQQTQVVQSLEGYVLSPLVFQRSVDIPPLLTMSAQVVLGTMIGVLGGS